MSINIILEKTCDHCGEACSEGSQSWALQRKITSEEPGVLVKADFCALCIQSSSIKNLIKDIVDASDKV